MKTMFLRIYKLSRLLFLMGLSGPVCGSSTIFDGYIASISDAGITVQRSYSPYSSPSVLASMTTKVDGTTFAKPLKSQRRGKDIIHCWYLDDIPVSWEEFKANVEVGTRVSTFENRGSWYYVHASLRGHGNDAGTIDRIEEGTVTLRRTQGNQLSVMGDYSVYKQYLYNRFALEEDAVLIREGKPMPAKGQLQPEDVVFVLQARKQMRVELLPPNFGQWQPLVSRSLQARRQTIGNYLGIYTAPIREGNINLGGLHYMGEDEPEPGTEIPLEQPDKVGKADIVSAWTLANAIGHEAKLVQRGIYRKGGWWMLDGIWVTHDPLWKNPDVPGAWFVAHFRRGRSTPDNFFQASEAPAAWGVITKVEGKTLTLETPEIPGLTASPASITLDDDALYKRFSKQIPAEELLQVGNLIRIYSPRPQTFLSNDGQSLQRMVTQSALQDE